MDHPLAELSTAVVDGEEIEVVNSWGFASMIVTAWLDEKPSALSMLKDCLEHSSVPDLNIPAILSNRSISEPERRTLINWVEAGVTAKLEQAFKKD